MNGRYLQLHLLTSYPPSNLNRDDLNRPKTAMMGGTNRLRVSSQCLKRNWRTSELFREALGRNSKMSLSLSESFRSALGKEDISIHPHIGTRTKDMGIAAYKALVDQEVGEKDAKKHARKIAEHFGKREGKKKDQPLRELQTGQVIAYSPAELQRINTLIEKLVSDTADDEDWELLRREQQAADIAMFGRMLANNPGHNVEAAVQVAHALTVHEVEVEDDFFTAVDDLNLSPETGEADTDSGSAHIGELEYGAGLFYLYLCVNRDHLKQNFQKEDGIDPDYLSKKALRALTEAAIKVTPSGKRNSFGHHTFAHFALAERGSQQPRGLHVAFLKVLDDKERKDMLPAAKERLRKTCGKMDGTYGACADARYALDFQNGIGKMEELLQFVTDDHDGNNPKLNGDESEEEA